MLVISGWGLCLPKRRPGFGRHRPQPEITNNYFPIRKLPEFPGQLPVISGNRKIIVGNFRFLLTNVGTGNYQQLFPDFRKLPVIGPGIPVISGNRKIIVGNFWLGPVSPETPPRFRETQAPDRNYQQLFSDFRKLPVIGPGIPVISGNRKIIVGNFWLGPVSPETPPRFRETQAPTRNYQQLFSDPEITGIPGPITGNFRKSENN